jgi:hypothetical protein
MGGSSPNRRRSLSIGAGVLLVVGVLLAALAIGASGDGGDGPPGSFELDDDVAPLGEMRAGSVASLVDCDDWSGGSVERQRATVIDIREQLTAGGSIDGAPSLTDQQAFDTFERACAEDFTGAFRLYKVYYQANAFEGFDPYEVAAEAEAAEAETAPQP